MSAALRRNLDETLSALADPTRRRVIDMLRVRPRRAGELAGAFDISAPAISRHLRVLRTRGLIEEERPSEDGRGRVYRLRPERFEELSGWLQEVQAFWGEQLDSFKAHVERTRGTGDSASKAGAGRSRARPARGARQGSKQRRSRK